LLRSINFSYALTGHQRAHPAKRSHYVVISRDGRKLVTTVRVMLP